MVNERVLTLTKRLEDMTLQELWQLFPISLVPHREEWAAQAAEEIEALRATLPSQMVNRISHVGSTAVPTICSKAIVDLLLETGSREQMESIAKHLIANGWRKMSQSFGRISLNKGYTEQGFADKVFHLHLRLVGDTDEIAFCQYLHDHEDVAKAYEALKLELGHRYEHDRDAYTNGKGAFIRHYTALAKQEQGLI